MSISCQIFLVTRNSYDVSLLYKVAHGNRSGEDGIPMLLKIPLMFVPWGGDSIIVGDIILSGLAVVC
ncbi:hypothetical protein SAY87_015033 [Trapa incisa]|uniref:Uncharacterized protein n=1 Tax=Trapa incisa TaxID=236973 RepID=A0AAN7JL45_9MYRT|nr:hypothetical protein SAY87_015033 [Trapa incisa]